jgi:thiosulfate dehydrogenase (quinone) large subunit
VGRDTTDGTKGPKESCPTALIGPDDSRNPERAQLISTTGRLAMTITRHHDHHIPDVDEVVVQHDVVTQGAARRALAAFRLGYGVIFLWAFLDKTFALGFATGRADDGTVARFGDAAWINGGSPTEGFLTFAVPADNPFKETFTDLAGQAWVDWLFMIGLLGIGLALTLGITMRIAAATGALLYLFMYAAFLPLENNPVVDDHLMGAVALVVLGLTLAGDTWGAGRAWARTRLVRSNPVLR